VIRGRPSQTAEVVCLLRATDQRRKPAQRILDDSYARWFLGPLASATLATWEASGRLGDLAERLSPGVTTFVLVRHRYIDDRLVAALASGRIHQVVLLGAGYDTRAYRFASALAGRPVFEVDFPATSGRKARILVRHVHELPKCDVRRVEIDFQKESLEERLLASGFEKGRTTFFVWEGVSMYLTREAVKGTLAAMVALGGAGSELAMDFWYLVDAPDLLSSAYRASASALSLVGEPVTFGLHPEDAVAFLERQGFRVEEVADAAVLEQRYVRDRRRVHPAMYLVHARVI
jgi:methyltransferase (TIGR00027 family)